MINKVYWQRVQTDASILCNSVDHDQLFYLVYEKVKVSEVNMEPHLWSYRQRISLEHLGQTLLEKKLKVKYPILHEFLQKVKSVLIIMFPVLV